MNDERIVEVIADSHLLATTDQTASGLVSLSKRWRVLNARAVLTALRADGFEVYRPEELTRVGWCPRGDGHADIPEPDDPNDFGICGSKWTHTALMTPWEPVEDQ